MPENETAEQSLALGRGASMAASPISPAQDSGAAVRFHDNIADAWDAKYCSGGFLKRAEFFRSKVMQYIKGPGRWLDAGCGSGYFSRLLAGQGLTVTGVDASVPMVESGRQLAARSHMAHAIQFEAVPTVEQLPFADASFNGCICLSVIEYLNDPSACLSELARVVAPGGMLVLSLPHRLAPIRLTQRFAVSAFKTMVPSHWEYSLLSRNAVSRKGLARMLDGAGFELRKALAFDQAIPAGLLRLIPPSLIFAIAVRRPAAAVANR
jgi:2-polyprenyl-6-hydroxyphenyl methylase/3-demethylubiquinone-9 3-methyltransferase